VVNNKILIFLNKGTNCVKEEPRCDGKKNNKLTENINTRKIYVYYSTMYKWQSRQKKMWNSTTVRFPLQYIPSNA